MSVRDEQCREIAKKLRYTANDDIGGLSLQRQLAAITKAEDGSWRGVMRRLADLIDRPTAKRDDAGENTCSVVANDEGFLVCSNCGRIAAVLSTASYCPNCGAKVMS